MAGTSACGYAKIPHFQPFIPTIIINYYLPASKYLIISTSYIYSICTKSIVKVYGQVR